MGQRVLPTPVSSLLRRIRFCFPLACFILLAFFAIAPPAQAEADDITADSLTWPLLPGENLNQLARLFYPEHPAMRPLFIARSISLSREMHPEISAERTYDQITSIIIPDLKALSQHRAASARPSGALTMARQMSEASIAIVTEAMWKEYEGLVESNQHLKLELEKLNAKLDKLNGIMQQVTEAALNLIERQQDIARQDKAALPASEVQPVSTFKPGSQPEKTRLSYTSDISTKLTASLPFVLLLLLGLAVAAYLINRRHPRNLLDSLGDALIQPLDWHKAKQTIPELEVTDEVPPYVELIQVENLGTSSEALAQARIMAGSGRPKSAIALLKASIETHTDASLDTWFYLLELYRELGLKKEFIECAQRLHSGFNVMTPQWEIKEIPLVTANSLEEFPHIVEQLVEHWKAGTAAEYLDSLIKDNREGERAGFSLPVLQEITLLQAILKIRE